MIARAAVQADTPVSAVVGDVTLSGLQREGAVRARTIVERHGGAVLADSVGMGKTYVALQLIDEAVGQPGGLVLVVVPATLRYKWRLALRAAGHEPRLPREDAGASPGRVLLTSHTRLHRLERTDGWSLIVVDEAHQFRNPRTARYRALARLVDDARVLLLTATPVNNSPADLYWLLRLFLGDGALADAGVPDLRTALLSDEHPELARRVVARVVVRRTRADLTPEHRHGTLRFPRQLPPRPLRYEMPGAMAQLAGCIASLRLTAFDVEAIARGAARLPTPRHPVHTAALVRIGLLKRLESSAPAFVASITRLLRFLESFEDAVRCGGYLRPRDARTNDPLQLSLTGLLARPLPRGCDTARLLEDVRADRGALERMLADARCDSSGAKPDALHALLRQLGDEPRVVFTEFADTANALFDVLPKTGTALLHGARAAVAGGALSRRAVLERFAPRAHGASLPAPHERIHTLIATDVLSEGLDLQDARHCISYDLPWNPVRLMQRAGRIDRLGSPHDDVSIWYFEPTAYIERLLGLMRRLGVKVQRIAQTVGMEQGAIADWSGEADRAATGSVGAGPGATSAGTGDARSVTLRRLLATCATHDAPGSRVVMSRAETCRVVAPTLLLAWQTRCAGWAEGATLSSEDIVPLEPADVIRLLTALHPPARAMPADQTAAREALRAALATLRAGRHRAPPSSVVRRAADRLRRAVAAHPGGPSAGFCRRADRLLRRLRQGLPAGATWQLQRVLQRDDLRSAPDLCIALETSLHIGSTERRDEHPQLRAVLLLEPPSA